jgi:hypothetical protein
MGSIPATCDSSDQIDKVIGQLNKASVEH